MLPIKEFTRGCPDKKSSSYYLAGSYDPAGLSVHFQPGVLKSTDSDWSRFKLRLNTSTCGEDIPQKRRNSAQLIVVELWLWNLELGRTTDKCFFLAKVEICTKYLTIEHNLNNFICVHPASFLDKFCRFFEELRWFYYDYWYQPNPSSSLSFCSALKMRQNWALAND